MSFLLIFVPVLLLMGGCLGCPFNPNALPTVLGCVQNIVCVSKSISEEVVLLQNCNKNWYYGVSGGSLVQLTDYDHYPTFVSSDLSTSMKANEKFALINFNN